MTGGRVMAPRVLGALRLSRDDRTSTSIQGQREAITQWAESCGYEVTSWADDSAVSGGVPARERPELARMLAAGQADIVAGFKIERLSRDTEDFLSFARWLNGQGIWLAATAEGIILKGDQDAASQFQATILAASATMERQRGSERCRDSANRLAQAGRWRGGRPPLGYVPEPLPSGGFVLVQDAESAETVRLMVKLAVGGASNGMIADALNTQGVRSPRNGTSDWSGWWTAEVIRRLLRNPSLAGWSTRRGQVVRDQQTGQPVMVTTEPILSADEWTELQAALDSRRQRYGERVGGHMLLRVAYCKTCSSGEVRNGHWKPVHDHAPDARCPQSCQRSLYGHHAQGKRSLSYYKCQACGYGVRKADLEGVLEQMLLSTVGDRCLPRKVIIPALNHTSELTRCEMTISDIENEVSTGQMPASSASRMLSSLETEAARLRALPQRAAEVRYEPGDVTVRDHWATLDDTARGMFYRAWGCRVYADRDGAQARFGWESLTDEGTAMARAFGLG